MTSDADNAPCGLSPVTALRTIRAIMADAELTLAERLTVVAVVLAADKRDATAWASYRAIRAEYGLSSDSVASGIRKATGRWLTVHGTGRRGATRYRVLSPSLQERPAQQMEALRTPERSESPPALQRPERSGPIPALRPPVQSAPATGAERSGHRSDSCPSSCPLSSRQAAAGEKREELKKAGIGEPALSQLAELEALTIETVREVISKARQAGHGNGLLVHKLREAVAPNGPQVRAASDATARDESRQQRRRTDAEQLQTIERERLEREAIIEALSPDELTQLTADVLANAPPIHRDRWRKANPRNNIGLNIAVCELWRQRHRAADISPEAPTAREPRPEPATATQTEVP